MRCVVTCWGGVGMLQRMPRCQVADPSLPLPSYPPWQGKPRVSFRVQIKAEEQAAKAALSKAQQQEPGGARGSGRGARGSGRGRARGGRRRR
jgi:hypothetical protein